MSENFWEVWNVLGEKVSKTFIGLFYIFLIYQGIFGDFTLGWWWIPYLLVGTFASSLLFGMPSLVLAFAVTRLVFRNRPYQQVSGLYGDLLIAIFLVPMFFAVEYSLQSLAIWVAH